jgi:hypothetical protein
MATSSSYNYTDDRDTVIKDAMALIGAIGASDSPDQADIDLCSRILNRMLKAWDNQGLHIWTTREATLFLNKDVNKYTIGSAGSAHATESYVSTELAVALAASGTAVTVDSTTGMTANDNILIVQDDNSFFATTIASVDSGTTLTLTAGVDSAAAIDSEVYTYTTKIQRPLRIGSGRTQTLDSSSEVPMQTLTRLDYFNLPSKTTSGFPNHYYYDAQREDTGDLYVWSQPDTSIIMNFTYNRKIQDVDAATDNFDVPSEWLEALTYNLAYRIAPAFGMAQGEDYQHVRAMAKEFLFDAWSYDTDIGSVTLQPDRGY